MIALKVEDCSSATSCSECVSLGDPSCGWCMIENKCSRRIFCQDNNETRRYLTQGDNNSCINTIHIYQTPYVVDTHQQPHQVSYVYHIVLLLCVCLFFRSTCTSHLLLCYQVNSISVFSMVS